jgi:hypothetical protein
MKTPPKCTEQSTLHVLADHQHGFHGDCEVQATATASRLIRDVWRLIIDVTGPEFGCNPLKLRRKLRRNATMLAPMVL